MKIPVPLQLPHLPYDYGALEPVISKEALQTHHQKHHQAYVDNFRIATEKAKEALEKGDYPSLITLQGAIVFHGGGHENHSFFWKVLAPSSQAGGAPKGELAKAIDATFGSFSCFVEQFSKKALALQGSGWLWLAYDSLLKRLEIISTPNHGLVKALGFIPLMVIDLWEHAYYLGYKNDRASYVKEMWKIFFWKAIEENYQKAML